MSLGKRTAAVTLCAALFPLVLFAETESKEKPAPPTRFESLRTDEGVEYLDCQVVRVEPDALVVRHRKGVARISFFDLPREIRETFHFDPFVAIEHYRQETERQREVRWQTFWEKQRHEAEAAEAEDRKKLIEEAYAEWIPVEAQVVRPVADGFLARCQRVTFEKTTKRSKLGFLVEGPPKRKLVEFAGGSPILLRLVRRPGEDLPKRNTTWKGYVAPVAEPKAADPESAPVHRAVGLP